MVLNFFDVLETGVSKNIAKSYAHALSGSVKIEGVPASLHIRVYDRRSSNIIGLGWSKDDGSFAFRALPKTAPKSIMVIAMGGSDSTYNAQIFDFVTAYNPNPPAVEDATSEGAA